MLNLEDGIVGTQKQLLSWITAHFTAHPDLCSHPRYVGLFNRNRAPRQPPSTTSSITPALPAWNLAQMTFSAPVAGPSTFISPLATSASMQPPYPSIFERAYDFPSPTPGVPSYAYNSMHMHIPGHDSIAPYTTTLPVTSSNSFLQNRDYNSTYM